MSKTDIPALETFLIGSLELFEAGVPPSQAVSYGATDNDLPGIAHILGIPSIQALDEMSYDDVRATLKDWGLASHPAA